MISPEFFEELGLVPEDLSTQYMEYPTPNSKRRFVIQHHWRGKSLRKHEPIIIRENGEIKIVPISYFFKETERRDQIRINGIEVWTSKGFQPVTWAIRHRVEQTPLLRVHTNRGIIEVTSDHSLFKDGRPIMSSELKVNDIIDTIELPKLPHGKAKVDKEIAWLLGLFLAEGNKHRNYVKITQKDKKVVERIIKIASKYGLNWHLQPDGIEIQSLPFFEKCFIPVRCQDRNYRPSYWKTLPSFVFSWNKESKEALLEGFILGDGLHSRERPDFATTSKCLALGMMLLIKSLKDFDFYVYLQELKSPSGSYSKVYRVSCVDNSHSRSKKPGTITKIERIVSNNPEIYVYDIETETHDFLGGVGRLRAHNSVHKDFRMEFNDHLIGWTILDNPSGTPKVETMKEAREALKKLDWGFTFEKQNKGLRAEEKCYSEICDEWQYKLEEIKDGIVYVQKITDSELSELEELARQPCIYEETFVVTDSGLKKAKNVDELDRVLSSEGTFQRILRIQRVPMKSDMYRITPRHGLEVEVDGDHPFLINDVPIKTFDKSSRKERKMVKTVLRPKWIQARDLKENMIVLFPKLKCNEKGTYDEGRLHGFFLGDGSKYNSGKNLVWRFYFNAKKEVEKALDYQELLSRTFQDIKLLKRERRDNVLELCFRLNTKDNFFFEQLYQRNKKYVPSYLLEQSLEYSRGFIDGLVESDGYIDRVGTWHIINSNPSIINAVFLTLTKFGIMPSIRYRRNTKYSSSEKGNMIFELAWSWNSREIFDYGSYLGTRIKRIEKIDPKPLINIITEDHTIPLPYMITHNTEWLEVEGVVKPGQVGACFKEAKVLTDKGLKEIWDVQKGDLVYTAKGRWKPVTEVIKTPREQRKCYEVFIKPGGSYVVTEDHPFLIAELWYSDKRVSNRIKQIRWITASQLFDLFYSSKHNKEKFRLAIPRTEDKSQGTYNLGLLVGFALGDGYLRDDNRIELYFNQHKEGRLARFYQHLGRDLGISINFARKHNSCIVLSFVSKKVKEIIEQLKEKPITIFSYSKTFAKGLIDGLLDADGYSNKISQKKEVKNIIPLAALHSDLFFSVSKDKRTGVDNIIISECGKMISDDEKFILKQLRIRRAPTPKETWNLSVEEDESFMVPNAIVHNTAENVGVLHIVEKGHFWEGAQKPYFHEYFIKSDTGNFFPKDRYVRIIFRAVKVPRIDPETKKPKKGQYELMWRVLIPSDQVAYALKRGMQKGWKPPEGVIPIPPDQRKGELWEKWLEFMEKKGVKEEKPEEESLTEFTCEECTNFEYCTKDIPPESPACDNFDLKEEYLKTYKFTLHSNVYMGQIVIRAIPHIEYYFRLETDEGVLSWHLDGNPIFASEIAASFEGKVDKKWLTFEGDLKPGEPYNPTKTLVARMRILDSGTAKIEKEETKDGALIYTLTLNGKGLRGKYQLIQEEKESDIFVWKKIEAAQESLTSGEFVLHRHYWDEKEHWDVRVKLSTDPSKLIEWNLYGNPLEVDYEQPIRSVLKVCYEPAKWFIKEGHGLERKVGNLTTYIDVLDTGPIEMIELTEGFLSMKIYGKKLKGYWVLKRDPNGVFYFIKSRLPSPEKEEKAKKAGDPSTGSYYSPFKKTQKEGWNYYWLEIYDLREFTRCVEDPTKYIPELKNKPKEILDVLVCLYERPGTIHGARVARVKVSNEWTEEEATEWIKKLKLHTWQGELIREKRNLSEELEISEDELLRKIIAEELKKREKTPEERKLELELKKKKLELIEKWLEANKE